MTRWKAAGIHMAIGLLLIATIVGSIFYFWFPHALYRIAGLNRLLITMLCVDLVAGPMLTCIVYKAGDKRTKWDLTVVGILQAAFLGYALHTAWITRPVFLVWSVEHMELIFANEIRSKDLNAAAPGNRRLPWLGPRLVAIKLPKNSKAREKAFIAIIRSQTTVERMPGYYGSYPHARAEVLRNSIPVEPQLKKTSQNKRLSSMIASTGLPAGRLRYAPIESSRDAAIMLLDGNTSAPLKVVPLDVFSITPSNPAAMSEGAQP